MKYRKYSMFLYIGVVCANSRVLYFISIFCDMRCFSGDSSAFHDKIPWWFQPPSPKSSRWLKYSESLEGTHCKLQMRLCVMRKIAQKGWVSFFSFLSPNLFYHENFKICKIVEKTIKKYSYTPHLDPTINFGLLTFCYYLSLSLYLSIARYNYFSV